MTALQALYAWIMSSTSVVAAVDNDDTTVTVNLVFVLLVLAIIALLVWIFWGWRRRR